jgi:hypothetical protein
MAAEDIFDFETIFPNAAKTVLSGDPWQLKAFTLGDDPSFTKNRPRVEIVYRHVGETSPRRTVVKDGSRRGAAFNGELKFHAITDADPVGKTAHSQYRAKVRAALSSLQTALNGEVLKLHKLQWLEPGNEETGIRPQDNYQQTTFPFRIAFSIQDNAWEQLT